MDKVVHFELVADDVPRAKKFYSETFGWEMTDMPGAGYTLIRTVKVDDKMMPVEPGAINGGLMERKDAWQHPIIVLHVDDLPAALEKVKANGGEVIKEELPAGELGIVGYVRDTEGNLIGLFQAKK